jgi:tetratricopeptide (TPR) repeat protein
MAGVVLASLLFSPWAAAQSTMQSPVQTAQAAPSLSEKSLTELQRRVNDGQFALAYDMAKSMVDAQGDPHFDFLYGVAAVNVGRSAEAVLALQRHLALVPGNDRARLDLARAYFDLGEYVRARQEFEFVLRYNPPAEVRANITRYLDAMQTREALSSRANVRFYAEIGYGQDTNTNLGTYNDTLNAASLSGTQIDPTSKGQFSNFAWVAAGGRWVRQVNAPFAVFAGVDVDNKLNQDTPQFNTADASVYSGFSLVSGSILYRLSVSDAVTSVSNSRYSGRLATSGEMQYALGDGLSLSGRLQYAEQSYSADINYRDATVETFGIGVENTFATAWRPTVGLQLSEAKEDNLAKRLDLSRVLDTWRLSMGLSPTDKIGLLLAYSEQQAAYQGMDLGFNSVRSDTLATLDLILSYSLDSNWTLRADIQQMDNKSNQSLYAFRRTMGGLKLRYSF